MLKKIESVGKAAKLSRPRRQATKQHHPLISEGATNVF